MLSAFHLNIKEFVKHFFSQNHMHRIEAIAVKEKNKKREPLRADGSGGAEQTWEGTQGAEPEGTIHNRVM